MLNHGCFCLCCCLFPVAALPFFVEQLALALNHLPLALAKVTAQRAIGSYHAVAWHLGREWVTLQCLPHSLRTAATYAPRQLAICDSGACGNIQQFHVHPSLERGYLCGCLQPFAYIHNLIVMRKNSANCPVRQL